MFRQYKSWGLLCNKGQQAAGLLLLLADVIFTAQYCQMCIFFMMGLVTVQVKTHLTSQASSSSCCSSRPLLFFSQPCLLFFFSFLAAKRFFLSLLPFELSILLSLQPEPFLLFCFTPSSLFLLSSSALSANHYIT